MKISHWILTAALAAGAFHPLKTYAQPGAIANNTKLAMKVDKPVSFSLFEISNERDVKVDEAIKNVVYLKLNQEALKALNLGHYKTLSFELPLGNSAQKIFLSKYDIFTSDFKAGAKDQSGQYKVATMPEGLFYRGFQEGSDKSVVALSFYNNEIGGVISIPGVNGNYNLVLNKENPGPQNDHYMLFKESDIIDGDKYTSMCKNESIHENYNGAQTLGKRGNTTGDKGANCQVVTIALYGDYKLYQKNQNSLTATQNYLTTVFNGVAALYENEQIRVALKALNINTAQDNYPITAPAVLAQFGAEINTNVTANLMQMVTGYTTNSGGNQYAPLGGLAWLNVLCMTPFAYNYNNMPTYVGPFSMINTVGSPNIPQVPVYSWDINCSTHELGHNLGSPHTHECYWNGNGTPIDNCAGTYDVQYADLNCTQAGLPANQGTMMSYCHLLSNIGINFANGFGPQPGDTLRNRIAEAVGMGCLSGDYYATTVVDQASQTVVANGFCIDGNKLYCYDTKNDFNRLNDELVLIISNSNISNLNLSNLQISMHTTPTYGTGLAVDASTYTYVNGVFESWYHANRSWSIELNQTLAGTTAFTFPFLAQDKADLTGSFAAMNSANDSMRLVVYKSSTAALSPETAAAADVQIYNLGSGNNAWIYGTNQYYQTATISSGEPFYGATFATGKHKSGVGIGNIVNSKLVKLYPNPVSDKLQIVLSENAGTIQHLELSDYLGRTLFTQKTKGQEQTIDVKGLADGVYMIKCVTDKGIYLNKFVKQ